MSRSWVIGVSLFFVSLPAAFAGELGGTPPRDCQEEVQAVCHATGVSLDICLQTRGNDISQECRKQVWESHIYAEDQEGPGACATDLQALCPGPDIRSIQKCLRKKMHEMPRRCLDTLMGLHTS